MLPVDAEVRSASVQMYLKKQATRKALVDIFDDLNILRDRRHKPLPPLPTTNEKSQINTDNIEMTDIESNNIDSAISAFAKSVTIKRFCMAGNLQPKTFPDGFFKRMQDQYGRLETTYGMKYESAIGCKVCNPEAWIFRGNEFDPTISLLYALKDGCLASNVKLIDPKFIIPWRYINRRSGQITWKIIHQTMDEIKDAERFVCLLKSSETIVVNFYRDTTLMAWIANARELAKSLSDADLVENLLISIQEAMGTYGLPRGSTATEADDALFVLMKK
jgi:hypothetical protein